MTNRIGSFLLIENLEGRAPTGLLSLLVEVAKLLSWILGKSGADGGTLRISGTVSSVKAIFGTRKTHVTKIIWINRGKNRCIPSVLGSH